MIFFVCVVGVWQRNFEPAVCVPVTTSWELLLGEVACKATSPNSSPLPPGDNPVAVNNYYYYYYYYYYRQSAGTLLISDGLKRAEVQCATSDLTSEHGRVDRIAWHSYEFLFYFRL